ncbi:MAG: hypothetical protein V1772_02325 [Chloroflexota bacterium]
MVERSRVRWHDGEWHEQAYPADYLAREVQNLVDVLLGAAEPLCSGEMALPAHRVCFAAYRSSTEQRPIRLDGKG